MVRACGACECESELGEERIGVRVRGVCAGVERTLLKGKPFSATLLVACATY